MATPSLAMIPSAYADSKLYSVIPNNGDGDFTFTRDSAGTRIGSNGLIQTVGFFGNNLITNGDFTTDSDWVKGAGWSIEGGVAVCDGTQTAGTFIRQDGTYTNGVKYKITFTVTVTAGSIVARLQSGGATVLGAVIENSGTYTEYLVSTGNNDFRFRGSTDFVGTVDNVSVEEVLGDQPRLNYDLNANGEPSSCPSFLMEKETTNLSVNSQDFSRAAWGKLNASITANVTTSPDGLINADKITDDTVNANHRVSDTFAVTDTKNYTMSVFAKYVEGSDIDKIFLLGQTSTPTTRAYFDIKNGIALTGGGTIENYGNGWYRASMVVTANTTGNLTFGIGLTDTDGSADYSGTGNGQMFIWGAQSEINVVQTTVYAYASSYIPTSNIIQSRAQEGCIDGGNANTFNNLEGVLYTEIAANVNDASFRAINLNDGTDENRVTIRYRSNDDVINIRIEANDVSIVSESISVTSALDFHKVAFQYTSGDIKVFIDGVSRYTSATTYTDLTIDRVNFDSGGNTNRFRGKCKDLRVYNESLTDAQLIALTQ
jgi:hypothetical protein